MDVYGRELAARAGARELRTDVGRRSAEVFGSWPGPDAARADVAFARRLRRTPGLVHLTGHHLARYGPFAPGPYVVTVHDLIRHHDAWGGEPLIDAPTARDRAVLALDRRGIRRAAALVAVSHHTAREVVDRLCVPRDRVHVVPEAVDHERFRPVAGRPLEEPYVLFVGSEHPRKDLPGLLRALALLRRERRFAALRLVKVGEAGRPAARHRAPTLRAIEALGLRDAVLFAGRVPDADLPRWYSGAACLALPSRHEGFGLPPLEAMACGCPVVVSTAGALPEVAGDAALTVAPGDAGALAATLRAVLADRALARRLSDAGRRRAAGFTWERTVAGTLAVYERALAR